MTEGSENTTARGLGLLSGLATALVAGALDAALMFAETPAGALSRSLYPLVVADCIAVLLSVGVILGVLLECALFAARQSPSLVTLADFVTDGPRRWFAPAPDLSTALVSALCAFSLVVSGLYTAALSIAKSFHSQPLAALAITLSLAALVALSALAFALLAPALAWVFQRAKTLGAPGVLVILYVALATLGARRFYAGNEQWLKSLEWSAIKVFAAMGAAIVLTLASLGAWRRRAKRPVAIVFPAAALALSLGASAFVAVTFGARQTVATNIVVRSAVTSYCLRVLTAVTDLDRDGYSALYNGGDCNDHDRRINPAARDVPGNGVDENCSGHDARPVREDGDGHFATLPAPERQPSFLLLSIDAMRPDHMGCYGYSRPTTPRLDRFAQGAARFTHAYCASPRSLRSFASIWTGRYPSTVRWGEDNQYPPLDLENVTLAERLHDAGWATAAFCNGDYFARTVGFFQGFEAVREGDRFKSDPEVTIAQTVDWVRARAAEAPPFFAWVHLLEPHEPYRDRTAPRDFGHAPIDQYDEELARADEVSAPLLDAVDEIARARPVIVMIIGDHGEAFGEHGWLHHSYDLHEEAVRVPVLIRAPGVAPGVREPIASLMDLSPTVLNFAGLRPPEAVDGWSLARPLTDPTTPRTGGGWRDHLYAEVTPDGMLPFEQKALIAPPFKLQWDVRRGLWELFDLDRDPRETVNLFDERPALAAQMRDRLTSWVEGLSGHNDRSQDLIAAARLPGVPTMQHPVHVRFGDVVELLGYDLDGRSAQVLGSIHITLYLRPLRVTREPVWLTVSFESPDGTEVSQGLRASHYAVQGRYPSTRWVPGEILRDEVTLRVEPEVRPGLLRMRFKVEHTGRLRNEPAETNALPDGSLDLGEMMITPAPGP